MTDLEKRLDMLEHIFMILADYLIVKSNPIMGNEDMENFLLNWHDEAIQHGAFEKEMKEMEEHRNGISNH